MGYDSLFSFIPILHVLIELFLKLLRLPLHAHHRSLKSILLLVLYGEHAVPFGVYVIDAGGELKVQS